MIADTASDQRTVITGSSGIAAATARALAARDHQVFILGIDPDCCKALAQEVNQPHNWCAVDLREEEATRAAFTTAHTIMGGLTGLVAVAGGSGRSLGDGDISDISLEAWNATLALNLTPTFLAMSAALGLMQQGGSVVAISSVLATDPQPDKFRTHAYAAAKGAINSLVKSVAAAYAIQGIRVNAVAPGLVETPMSARAQEDPKIQAFIKNKQPLSSGLLTATDVAQTIAQVLENPNMTGQIISIDGGWSVIPS